MSNAPAEARKRMHRALVRDINSITKDMVIWNCDS